MSPITSFEMNPTPIMTSTAGVRASFSGVGDLLSISPIEDDHLYLQEVFSRFRWTLHRAFTVPSAQAFLAGNDAPVVICERDLFPGTWRDVLDWAIALPQPPCVIVTSRLADENLWIEALHAGAYDVLAKPFETDEVIRVVSWATRHWYDQYLPSGMPNKPKVRAA